VYRSATAIQRNVNFCDFSMWDVRVHGTVFPLSLDPSYTSSKNPSLFRINLNVDLESTF
jgi:hypothetical protein